MHLPCVLASLTAGALIASAGSGAYAQSIGGQYSVAGTNFNGTPYGGTAEIILTSDVTCEIIWTSGASSSSGICMRNGDVFAAGYELNGAIGMVIYRVRSSGVLDGTWTIAGSNGTGTEVLTPQ